MLQCHSSEGVELGREPMSVPEHEALEHHLCPSLGVGVTPAAAPFSETLPGFRPCRGRTSTTSAVTVILPRPPRRKWVQGPAALRGWRRCFPGLRFPSTPRLPIFLLQERSSQYLLGCEAEMMPVLQVSLPVCRKAGFVVHDLRKRLAEFLGCERWTNGESLW